MVLTLLQMRFSATPSIYGYFIHFSDLFRFWVKIQVLTYILKRRIQLFSGLHTHPFCMRAFTSRYHFQLLNPHCAFHLPERSLFRANLFNFFGGGGGSEEEWTEYNLSMALSSFRLQHPAWFNRFFHSVCASSFKKPSDLLWGLYSFFLEIATASVFLKNPTRFLPFCSFFPTWEPLPSASGRFPLSLSLSVSPSPVLWIFHRLSHVSKPL